MLCVGPLPKVVLDMDTPPHETIKMNRNTRISPNIEVPKYCESLSTTISQHAEDLAAEVTSSGDDDKKVEAKDATKTASFEIHPDDIRPYDVLCGRDKATFNNIGNRRFRVSLSLNLSKYDAAKTKAQKASVIKVVCNVLQHDVGVRFLKRKKQNSTIKDDSYYYIELNDTEARKKVGHALRDMSVARQQLHQRRKNLLLQASLRHRRDENNESNSGLKSTSITLEENESMKPRPMNDNREVLGDPFSDENESKSIEDTMLEPLPVGAEDLHILPLHPNAMEMTEGSRPLSLQDPQEDYVSQSTDGQLLLEQQRIQLRRRQLLFRQLISQHMQGLQQQQLQSNQSSQMLQIPQDLFLLQQQEQQRQQSEEDYSFYHHAYTRSHPKEEDDSDTHTLDN